ncbi:MAG TPA: ethanolamine ammonia-lyase subunit EutB [Vicinamibacterales bacterium]|nr:ethanolamine ammonia-lyase subunit EutB [Vicinamibacterales bacterium]
MDGSRLRQLLALANPFKEGDLAVGGTTDDRLREDAQDELLAIEVGDIRRSVVVDDGVTAALERSRNRQFDSEVDELTIGRVKSLLLGHGAAAWARRHQDALASEAIAAVVKVMSNDELSTVARSLFNPLASDGVTIGAPHQLGSRIQPNSPGDDEYEILFSIFEGLAYGCGDVVVGLNPAADDLETIIRLEQLLEQVIRRLRLPTRYCVLSDIVKQREAQKRTHIDVGFQSLAGTSRALAGMVGLDVDGLVDLAGSFDRLYFETGQGAEVTNGVAEGADMVTLEARTYGLARHIRQAVGTSTASGAARQNRASARPWMIVNDVAGFIGPEVFRTSEQLERVCLEDTVMAKLHGLTMGLDVCATFHMGIAPDALKRLTERVVARAAPAYLMAVAGNADPMLGYMTTSFREHPPLRASVQRRPASAMVQRLAVLGVPGDDGEPRARSHAVPGLYAAYAKAGGDGRTVDALEDEGRRRLHALRERGFDLGVSHASEADARLDAIYSHARDALYALLNGSVIRDATARHVRVRTAAVDRDDYLAHPTSGEYLPHEAANAIRLLYPARPPEVQVVISDGLNANAINENLRAYLPRLRRMLAEAGHHVGDADVVVTNGRVRVGYEIGGLVGAAMVIHLIGERPGTGLNTLSAYLTYGRDEGGRPRWSRSLDHAATTAICGVHPRAKPPHIAVAETARTVAQILTQKRSGVALCIRE